jgi:hypothetical protein
MQDGHDVDDVRVDRVHDDERSTRDHQLARALDPPCGRRFGKSFELIDSVKDALHLRRGRLRIDRVQVLESGSEVPGRRRSDSDFHLLSRPTHEAFTAS